MKQQTVPAERVAARPETDDTIGGAEVVAFPKGGANYRYEKVTTSVIMDDFRFNKGAPSAGDPFPDFDLTTTDGHRIRKQDYVGQQPLLLVFGSVSCPMTASSIEPLKRLYREFGKTIEFVMLNVREAHPAENYTQPATFAEKLAHAHKLQTRYDIPWTVATDDIDGTLHQALDTKPNAAYLMDINGRVGFRALWAGDEEALRQVLETVSAGRSPTKPQSRAMLKPLALGIGYIHEVLKEAGPQAQRDMLLAAPPMALAGAIANLFRPLPKNHRGTAALITIAAAVVIITVSVAMAVIV